MNMVAGVLSIGLPRLLNRMLFTLVVVFAMLCLWCIFKVWSTPLPGARLPAESALTPLSIEGRVASLDSDVVTDRPLFWRGRTPMLAESVIEEPSVDDHSGDLAKIKVVGLYPGGAMISGVKGKTRIVLGDEVFGWKLNRIAHQELIFEQDGRSEVLPLEGPDALDLSGNVSSQVE